MAAILVAFLVCMGIAAFAGFEFGRQADCGSEEGQFAGYFSSELTQDELTTQPGLEVLSDDPSGAPDDDPASDATTSAVDPGWDEEAGAEAQQAPGSADAEGDAPVATTQESPGAASQPGDEPRQSSAQQVPGGTPPEEAAEEYPGGIRPLQLQAFSLRKQEGGEAVRCRFDVTLKGSRPELVTGSIWIAIDGRRNGKPVRLRLRDLTRERTTFVPMRFEEQQAVDVAFIVPDDFTPIRVVVEAKPLQAEDYQAVTETFDWTLPTN